MEESVLLVRQRIDEKGREGGRAKERGGGIEMRWRFRKGSV